MKNNDPCSWNKKSKPKGEFFLLMGLSCLVPVQIFHLLGRDLNKAM